MRRDTVFLEEMGIGPLWRRRHQATPVAGSQVAAAEPARQGMAAHPHPAASAVLAPAAAPVPASAANVPAAKLEPAAPRPQALSGDDSTAWFDDAPMPAPAAPVSDAAIAAMDWDELRAAAARCTRCELCQGRKGVVFGRGEPGAAWLIVGAGPSRADEREGRALSGEAGILLDNMLRAIGQDAGRDAYVTNLVKCRPGGAAQAGAYAPTPQQAAACRPYLERELALTRARTIVTLGQAAAIGLLGPQAASRGTARQLGTAAVVATYHPQDLLPEGENKAKAWADLCLARSAHGAAR